MGLIWYMKQLLSVCLVFLILILSACESDETRLKEAERVAQGLAIAWQNEDYGTAYDYIIPELQSSRNKEDFIEFVEASQNLNKFGLIYDKVVLQDKDLAYAYYTFSGESAFQPKTPAIEMDLIDGEWKINGFAGYFTKDCIIDDCEEEARTVLELDTPKRILDCLETSYSLSYDDCKEITEESIEITMNSFWFKCDKSTKYMCEPVKKT